MAAKAEPVVMLTIDSGYGDILLTRKLTWKAKLRRIWGELTNNYVLSIYGENFIPRYTVEVFDSIGGIRNAEDTGSRGPSSKAN